jgi:HrpA-like RNA helicase
MIVKNLPISAFEAEISEALLEEGILVVSAETGAGKSTQLPQIFFKNLGVRVIVSEPRVLLSRQIAKTVAQQMGCKIGSLVGYRNSEEDCTSSSTQIIFETDGCLLNRLFRGDYDSSTVIVLDDIHEFSVRAEMILAIAKDLVGKPNAPKFVVASATIDIEEIEEFFSPSPVETIKVPGRMFPVEYIAHPGDRPVKWVVESLKQGEDVLCFLPGKGEIGQVIDEVKREGFLAFPLHGDLTKEEQDLCFSKHTRPKVVCATNVAQMGVTPPISVVVCSGLERRTEVRNGVEGLYLLPISEADLKQQLGRAGRIRSGKCYDCTPNPEKRSKFPVPEIFRKLLSGVYLQFSCNGMKMEETSLLHSPPMERILSTKADLHSLGCLENDHPTPLGRQVEKFSTLEPELAIALVEAKKLGVLFEVGIIISVMQSRGIKDSKNRSWRQEIPSWDSDVMSDLSLMLKFWSAGLRREDLEDRGIVPKKFKNAKKVFNLLCKQHFGGNVPSPEDLVEGLEAKAELIHKALLKGLFLRLHKKEGYWMKGTSGTYRKLGRESVAQGDLIVGQPFDLDLGSRVLPLLNFCFPVKAEWVQEVAPHLVSYEEVGEKISIKLLDIELEAA